MRKVYQYLLQKFSIGFLEALYKSSSFDPDTPCIYRANPDAAGVFRPSTETISTIGGDPMTQRVRSPCGRVGRFCSLWPRSYKTAAPSLTRKNRFKQGINPTIMIGG